MWVLTQRLVGTAISPYRANRLDQYHCAARGGPARSSLSRPLPTPAPVTAYCTSHRDRPRLGVQEKVACPLLISAGG